MIVAVGSAVSDGQVGAEVIITAGYGTYASHPATTPEHLVAKPARISHQQAAAIGIPASTA